MANSLAAFALGWCFRLVNLGISEVGIITSEVTNYQVDFIVQRCRKLQVAIEKPTWYGEHVMAMSEYLDQTNK